MQEVKPEPHTSDYFRRTMPQRARDFVHARTLFGMMDASEYTDLDLLDMDAAKITHDLNLPIPNELEGKFATVIDAGTCEHIFDVRQSFENMVRLCKVGGQITHLSPARFYLDHGFFCLNPMLFFDFYRANGFDVSPCFIWTVNPENYFETCPYFEYVYGMDTTALIDPHRYAMVFFAATKRETLPQTVVPMQGTYADREAVPPVPVEVARIRPLPPVMKTVLAPLRPVIRRLFPVRAKLKRI